MDLHAAPCQQRSLHSSVTAEHWIAQRRRTERDTDCMTAETHVLPKVWAVKIPRFAESNTKILLVILAQCCNTSGLR